jgi:hypothetical protein
MPDIHTADMIDAYTAESGRRFREIKIAKSDPNASLVSVVGCCHSAGLIFKTVAAPTAFSTVSTSELIGHLQNIPVKV